VEGNAGANVINGGAGNDTLYGDGGADSFLFNTMLNAATNVDRLVDFNVAADTIHLENAVFTNLPGGALAAGAFTVGAAAQDADDRIIYNAATGALTYDSNGSAAGGATMFALLPTSLALTHADFLVV
jgi:serralysin